MAELAVGPRVLVGPAAGAAVFLLLTGGRLPRGGRPQVGRALAARWASLGLAAALEEALWRGLVLGALAVTLGPAAGLALSTVGFAAWHWRPLGPRCAVHLVTGASFGAALLLGGLLAAVLAHGVYNVLVDLAARVDPGGRTT